MSLSRSAASLRQGKPEGLAAGAAEQATVICRWCGLSIDVEDYYGKLLARGWSGEACRLEHAASLSVGRVISETRYHRLRWNVSGFHGHRTGSIYIAVSW